MVAFSGEERAETMGDPAASNGPTPESVQQMIANGTIKKGTRCLVCGVGFMGSGIASVLAQGGMKVFLFDTGT